MIVEIDDEDATTTQNINNRPRTPNAGTGLERLKMDHGGEEYKTLRELNFITNGGPAIKAQIDIDNNTMMKVSCDVIFPHMPSKDKQQNMDR